MDPNVLHNISYGMFIVSSNKEKGLNGQIANTVFQITNQPVIIGMSINKKNLTYEFIEVSKHFSISILSEEAPLPFIGKFGFKSGRKEDKFKDVNFKISESGCPIATDYTIGYLEAKVVNEFCCGDHTLFIGEVIESAMLKSGKPMTYDYYHQVKHGFTPPSAPTFIKGEETGGKK